MGHFAYAEYTSTCVCLTFGLSSYYIMLIMSRPNNLSCRCIGINAAIYIALLMPSHAFPHLPPPPVFDHYHTIKTWSLVGLATSLGQMHAITSGSLQVIALHQNLVFPQYQESLKWALIGARHPCVHIAQLLTPKCNWCRSMSEYCTFIESCVDWLHLCQGFTTLVPTKQKYLRTWKFGFVKKQKCWSYEDYINRLSLFLASLHL